MSSWQAGSAARAWGRLGEQPVLAVGVPIPSVGATFYELSPTEELDSTLKTLALVLGSFALVTTLGGAAIGRMASARVVAPLDEVATAAASIAAGEMSTRLEPTADPDLAVIVGSFNTMVQALDERIQRDARFAADVAHELRSPVTTLMTSITLLRSSEGPTAGRRQAALDLVDREVRRLHRALEHLLELGRLDATVAASGEECVDVADLVTHALEESHRSSRVVAADRGSMVVHGDKQVLHRALVNLLRQRRPAWRGPEAGGHPPRRDCCAGARRRQGPGHRRLGAGADLRAVRPGGLEGLPPGHRTRPEPGGRDGTSRRGERVVRGDPGRWCDLRDQPALGGGGEVVDR